MQHLTAAHKVHVMPWLAILVCATVQIHRIFVLVCYLATFTQLFQTMAGPQK